VLTAYSRSEFKLADRASPGTGDNGLGHLDRAMVQLRGRLANRATFANGDQRLIERLAAFHKLFERL
jgi:hypothetical protein